MPSGADLKTLASVPRQLDVCAIVREILDAPSNSLMALELRIEQGGEVRDRKVYRSRKALQAHARALYSVLVSKGWNRRRRWGQRL